MNADAKTTQLPTPRLPSLPPPLPPGEGRGEGSPNLQSLSPLRSASLPPGESAGVRAPPLPPSLPVPRPARRARRVPQRECSHPPHKTPASDHLSNTIQTPKTQPFPFSTLSPRATFLIRNPRGFPMNPTTLTKPPSSSHSPAPPKPTPSSSHPTSNSPPSTAPTDSPSTASTRTTAAAAPPPPPATSTVTASTTSSSGRTEPARTDPFPARATSSSAATSPSAPTARHPSNSPAQAIPIKSPHSQQSTSPAI